MTDKSSANKRPAPGRIRYKQAVGPRLRKLLGEDRALVLRNGRLSLDRRYCWLDTWALEDQAEQVVQLLKSRAGEDAGDRVDALAESVFALYRGPFMQSEEDEPRYRAPRERLRNRFLRAVGGLARYWEDRGEWDKAADYYQRALEADTLAEGLYRRLMLCCRELGR